jgi:hypothetical protein
MIVIMVVSSCPLRRDRLRTLRAVDTSFPLFVQRNLDQQRTCPHGASSPPKNALSLARASQPECPSEDIAMARCEVCGNDYDKAFEVTAAGQRHTFDSFECAIHKLAPECAHCGCKIVGHGVEAHGTFFCCANCARMAGERGVADRAA